MYHFFFFTYLCTCYVGATMVGASAMGGESPMQWDHRNSILPIPQQGRDQSRASLHGIDQSQASIRAFSSLIRQGPIVGQLTWHRLISGQLTLHRPMTGQHTYLQFPYMAGTDPWSVCMALANHRPAFRLPAPPSHLPTTV